MANANTPARIRHPTSPQTAADVKQAFLDIEGLFNNSAAAGAAGSNVTPIPVIPVVPVTPVVAAAFDEALLFFHGS